MKVSQIAVFLENRAGQIAAMTACLAGAGMDIVAMNIADTADFGIARLVTRDNATAVSALKAAGFAAREDYLLGVDVDDEIGGLSKVLDLLVAQGVEVEYLYSYVRTEARKATILMKTSEPVRAEEILKSAGYSMLDNANI